VESKRRGPLAALTVAVAAGAIRARHVLARGVAVSRAALTTGWRGLGAAAGGTYAAAPLGARAHLLFGLSLAITSMICYSLGVVVQKRRALALPAFSGATAKTFISDGGWLGGTALSLVGWLLELGAMQYAPMGLVKPAMAAGIGLLAFFAVRWLDERLRVREWAGVMACSVGLAFLAFSTDPQVEVAAHVSNGGVLLPALVVLIALASVALVVALRSSNAAELGFGCAVGLLYAGTGLLTKALGIALVDDRNYARAFLLLAVMVGMGAVSLFALQRAYQGGRAIVVVTVVGVLADFLPIVLGGPVFGEAWPHGAFGVARLIGIATMLLGLPTLARPMADLERGPSAAA
jgi:hypothetical protein